MTFWTFYYYFGPKVPENFDFGPNGVL